MSDEVPVATPDGQVIAVWYLRAGATFIKRYQWKTGGVPASPGVPAVPATPVDLTGWIGRLDVVTNIRGEASTVVISLTSPTNIQLDAQGNVTITITPAMTKDLAPGKYLFDLELESPTGFVRNLVGGTISIARNITVEP